MPGGRRPSGNRGRPQREEKNPAVDWIPKTTLGKLVYEGEITTMSEALRSRHVLKEAEIVDILLPEMNDEVLDVNMVQRMTDSGRRVRFAITVVVGNEDGFVGMGRCKGKEVGPSIRKAIDNAKLNLIEIKRGCGSWECGCGNSHTLPFAVSGKSGSVVASFKPAPQGVGLAVGDVPKHVLRLAGIQDAWGLSKGHSKTTVNFSFASFYAMKNTTMVKVTPQQAQKLHIITGPVKPIYLDTSPEEYNRVIQEKKEKEEELIKKKKEEMKENGASGDGPVQGDSRQRRPRDDRRRER
ncbi:MAG: 30S ribosomal protein S5 [Thermoplasmata archaeon]|nr:30S ribosomal protein S5 [Thermoplasmata archaeon]